MMLLLYVSKVLFENVSALNPLRLSLNEVNTSFLHYQTF